MLFLKEHEKLNVYRGSERKKCPWIRIYKSMINDVNWHSLDPTDAKTLIGIFMIADPETGELPENNEAAFQLRIPLQEYEKVISNLGRWVTKATPTAREREVSDTEMSI